MNKPITIVTACFNSADTVEETIRSVAGQSVAVEHVVMDGGSSDGTADIISRNRHLLDAYRSEKDQGMYDALNKGIGISRAGIIGILNADDIYADEFSIENVLKAFSDPKVDAVYADLDYVDRNRTARVVRRWKAGEFAAGKCYLGWMPPHPTFFVRRECYERLGLYRLDLGTSADYELMLRYLLVHGILIKYIPRVLVKMRVGGASNVSLKARLMANRMDRKAWEVNNLKPHPWTLVAKPLRKIGQWWTR